MALNFDNFMKHKREVVYLNNTFNIELGSGYSYTSKPISPQLKEFRLHFTGFRYYTKLDGTIDYETNKNKNNLGALMRFYEEANLYTTFIYNDKQFGAVSVRFKAPLQIPKGIAGGFGVVEDFSIEVREVTN